MAARRRPQEIAYNTLPFWSRFIVSHDLRFEEGGATFRTIIAAGRNLPVFDYRKGERNAQALNGAQATPRDTILVTASQTRGGGLYTIHGVSYTKDGWAYESRDVDSGQGLGHRFFPPASIQPANGAVLAVPTVEDWRSLDSFFAWTFLQNFRTVLQIDGTRRILEMGPALLYPGIGGVAGNDVNASNAATFVANYMQIPEGIQWNPAGATDSNLVLVLESTYDVEAPLWTPPDAEFAGANPTPLGRVWSQAWVANFHGHEISPTSDIS